MSNVKAILNVIVILTFLFLFENIVFASSVQLNIFDTKNNGEIVYYNSGHVDKNDYQNSLNIRERLLSNNNDVHSIIIADIFGRGNNQYISLSENNKSKEKKVAIYSNETIVFEYVLSKKYADDVKVAIDIESFSNKNKKVGVIKLYVMEEENDDKKTVDLHMFISYNNKISFLSDILFYKQINTPKLFVSKVDIVFVDIDNDNTYEMLVSLSEIIDEKIIRIEYLKYEFDYKINNYVCVVSSWYDDTANYYEYFNN